MPGVTNTSDFNENNNSKAKFNPQEIKTINSNLKFKPDGKYSYSQYGYSAVKTMNKIGVFKQGPTINQEIHENLNNPQSQSIGHSGHCQA